MSAATAPGYILAITDTSLTINHQPVDAPHGVESALQLTFDQLSALNEARDPQDGPIVLKILDARTSGSFGEVTREVFPGAPLDLQTFAPREFAAPASVPAAEPEDLRPAPEAYEHESIFAPETIADVDLRTPVHDSVTAVQRRRGFPLQTLARTAVERRARAKKRVIRAGIALVAVLALVRVGGEVWAGLGDDYAAVCVDTRTSERLDPSACSPGERLYTSWAYFAQGQAVPAVGEPVSGVEVGAEPEGARTVNYEVAERAGLVDDGGVLAPEE